MQSGVFSASLRNWDIDGRVNVLKQWDIRLSLRLLNHTSTCRCITTGMSVVFSSYFALSRSQSFGSLCLLLAILFLPAVGFALLACCWLCSSRFFSSLLQIFDVLVVRSSYPWCFASFFSPQARWLWFRLCFFFRVTLWYVTTPWFVSGFSQHHYSALRHFVIDGSR